MMGSQAMVVVVKSAQQQIFNKKNNRFLALAAKVGDEFECDFRFRDS